MLAKTVYVTIGTTAALVNSVDFSGTVGLGSILVGLLVTILAGGANLRNRLLKDQIEGWKGNYQQEKEHAAQLEERLTEAVKQLSEARILIQRLEQLPNLERLVRLMSETQDKQQTFVLELHKEGMAAHRATLKAVHDLTSKPAT